jgi:medium-chain acyl-[acyl-carrier-protein] hydrolase
MRHRCQHRALLDGKSSIRESDDVPFAIDRFHVDADRLLARQRNHRDIRGVRDIEVQVVDLRLALRAVAKFDDCGIAIEGFSEELAEPCAAANEPLAMMLEAEPFRALDLIARQNLAPRRQRVEIREPHIDVHGMQCGRLLLMTVNPWLPFAPIDTNAQTRLFCLPHAGGGASFYRPWSAATRPSVQVAAIQLPGRENRLAEPRFDRMGALLPALLDGIRKHLDRPFAIFGHSMGALVAFELTRALRREGLPQPTHLFLSAHRAPQLPDRRPSMHQLSDDEFREALRNLEGTPEEVLTHPELMDLLMPLLRADFALCETYAYMPEAPLDVPLTMFGGNEDPYVTREELDAWRETTRAAARVQMFRGHHHYLQQEMRAVIDSVNRALS